MTKHRVTLTFSWPLTPAETREILNYTFRASLIMYLGLYVLENVKLGFVTNYFSLDPFLWLAIVAGLLSGLWPALIPAARNNRTAWTWHEHMWLGVLTLGIMAIAYTRLHTLGWLGLLIVMLIGVVVLGIGLSVYSDEQEPAGQ